MRMPLSGDSDRRLQGRVHARPLSRSLSGPTRRHSPDWAALSSREGRGQTSTGTCCRCETGLLPLQGAHWVTTGSQPSVGQFPWPYLVADAGMPIAVLERQ